MGVGWEGLREGGEKREEVEEEGSDQVEERREVGEGR